MQDPFDIFFALMDDLSEYQDHLVIVGGWVPWIYKGYLWKEAKYFPVKTTDIDIGVREFFDFTGTEIATRLKGGGYTAAPVNVQEQRPVQLSIHAGSEDYPIDFITGEYSSPDIIHKMTGTDLYVSSVDFFDFLLNHAIALRCGHRGKEYVLHVPTPAAYFFHKGVVLVSREEGDDKWKKDLYYLFYIIDNLPAKDLRGFVDELTSFRSEQEYFELFRASLGEAFGTVESKGPKTIADFFFNPGPLFRKYVWERFDDLLRKLG
jgi:hypothetical protein